MNTRLLFLSAFFLCFYSFAQNVTIPDVNFKAILVADTTINSNEDDEISTDEALSYSGIINVSNSEISDLTGIEAFENITKLYCSTNILTTLDVSSNTALETLSCSSNLLETINVYNITSLKELDCGTNMLTELDISGNINLENLNCPNNSISILDTSNNTKLTSLICFYNSLTSLSLSNNLELTTIWCYNNMLTELNVSMLSNLTQIDSNFNLIEDLDVSNNPLLNVLYCEDNSLKRLNINNNNNDSFVLFSVRNNPDLTCVQVDDETISFTGIDDSSAYSIDCYDATQIVSIPDTNFEQALIDLGYDTNGLNGNILESEAEAILELDLGDIRINKAVFPNSSGPIESFLGIESMINLTKLKYSYDQETRFVYLDVTKNLKLREIGISFMDLSDGLDLINNVDLEYLTANFCELEELEVNHLSKLKSLGLTENKLSYIDISNLTQLESLYLRYNSLTEIKTGNHPNLTHVQAQSNGNLSSFEVGNMPSLIYLDVSLSSLVYLDVTSAIGLTHLLATLSNLDSIDVTKNTSLTSLNVWKNNIDFIDVSNNLELVVLQCAENNISELNVTNNTKLVSLRAYGNNIKDIDVSQNPELIVLNIESNLLEAANIKNGNNSNITDFSIQANVSLDCVQVDNILWSESNWTDVDGGTIFSEDCYDLSKAVSIPDINFEQALIDLGYDTNGLNGNILQSEAEAITILNISNPLENDLLPNVTALIEDLTGVEAMVNLSILNAGGNSLTNIDVSSNTGLTKLILDNNSIESIDVSMLTNLTDLHLYYNNLSYLNVTNNVALLYLYIANNQLEIIDVSTNTALIHLYSAHNQLEMIDVSANTALVHLYVANNQITSLDVSSNIILEQLYAWGNQLTSLSVSNNTSLTQLLVNDNNLKTLTVKNENNSNITNIDISGNPNLVCVTVDDVEKANEFWLSKDATTSYSEDCSVVYEIYTTDENLEAALLAIEGVDVNEDGIISYEEAQAFTGDIDLSGQNITDITGLEAFTNVTSIDISNNSITDISSLFTSETVIVSAKSSNNLKQVAALNQSNLTILNVSNNSIKSIDLSNIVSISELYVSNNQLVYLNINNNANEVLTMLDATGNSDLFCIQVDDETNATNNVNWSKDDTASYSTSCGSEPSLSTDEFLKVSTSVYPNPTKDDFTITLSNGLELKRVSIFDISGKKVSTSNDEIINIQDFKTGIYFIQITTNRGVVNTKLMKK